MKMQEASGLDEKRSQGGTGGSFARIWMSATLAAAAIVVAIALIVLSAPLAHSSDRQAEPVLLTAQISESFVRNGPLEEHYQDWTVSCERADIASTCSIYQQLYHSQTQQRMLAIELKRQASVFSGVIVVPFGLRVDRSIRLLVDTNLPGYDVAVRTCVPAGCVIPVSFSEDFGAQLQRGSALNLNAVTDNDETVGLVFSLYGFSAATARLDEIATGGT